MRACSIRVCIMTSVLLLNACMGIALCHAQGLDEWVSDRPFSRLPDMPAGDTAPDVGMFMGHWRDASSRISYGGLMVRDILTPNTGDPLHPQKKGAVLTYLSSVSYAELAPSQRTRPYRDPDHELILYITGGSGRITAEGIDEPLAAYTGVLIPPGAEYVLTAGGTGPLVMYLVAEKVPAGYVPNRSVVVRNEQRLPLETTPGHWANVPKSLFWQPDDNTAQIIGMNPVWIDPMTMSQPHSHQPGVEEIWLSIEGGFDILFGTELMAFLPGSAIKIPSDGSTPHATINTGTTPVKTLWLMRIPAHGGYSPLNRD